MKQTKRIIGDGGLTVSRLKEHIHMMTDAFDAVLNDDLQAAVCEAENYTGLVIFPTLVLADTDFVPEIELLSPVIREVSVAVDGKRLNEAMYEVHDDGTLVIDPSIEGAKLSLEYHCGFEKIPADMASALMMAASALFNNPVDHVESLPKASTMILQRYRKIYII